MGEFVRLKSIAEICRMLGLPKPRHPLITVLDYREVRMQQHFSNTRFVTDFYIVSLKSPAPDSLMYGRQYYDFDEGSLFFMSPGQVFWLGEVEETRQPEGWSLFFHPDLIAQSPLAGNIKSYGFFSYSVHEALHVSEEEKLMLSNVIEAIRKEYENAIDDFSRPVIVTAIQQLLNYSLRFYSRQFITRHKQHTEVVSRFEELLVEYIHSAELTRQGIPAVEYFASRLNYSANYLSDLLKKETGKTIRDHIQFELLELAKIKLLNSNHTISEIAYELGFEYPQYFNRLFKTKVGLTPLEFRQKH